MPIVGIALPKSAQTSALIPLIAGAHALLSRSRRRGRLSYMHFKVMAAAATIVLIAGSAAAQQQERVFLSSAADREVWRGETAGSQAALSLDRGDVSTDHRFEFFESEHAALR